MTTAYVFWTILGTVAGVGAVLVIVAYIIWRFYLHPKTKVVGLTDSFYEEITETEIQTVTSHPSEGAMIVNVRTRTRSLHPNSASRTGQETNESESTKPRERPLPNPSRKSDLTMDPSMFVAAWNVPSLMNNWRDSEDDMVRLMSKSNMKQLPWKEPFTRSPIRAKKDHTNLKIINLK